MVIRSGFTFITSIVFMLNVNAQKAENGNNSKQNEVHKFAIFFNPLSVLEPQQGAIGAGIAYKPGLRWEAAMEFNYLFEGFCQGCDDYSALNGYRAIITLKRFLKKGRFFYGVDSRIKHYNFNDRQNFTNQSIDDTLFNYSHRAANTLIGGAIIAGVKVPISKSKRLLFEFNIGAGAKYRIVDRKNIPDGYFYHPAFFTAKDPSITDSQVNDGFAFYFPAGARLFYFF